MKTTKPLQKLAYRLDGAAFLFDVYVFVCFLGKNNFAMKRLQFHSFETTFGASEAPGRGDAFYDGFRADFEIDSS